MKLKLFVFLLLVSISVSAQVNGTAGYINYMNPNRGHEVQIEVKYQLRFVFGEIGLKTSFEARPSSNKRPYYINGQPFDLVQLGIPIDYSKIKYVSAVLDVTIGGSSKDITITFIERRFSGAGILLCSKFGLNREECSKYKDKLGYIDVRLKSVEVNTIDYDIEAKLRKILKGNGGNGTGSGTGIGTGTDEDADTGDTSNPPIKDKESIGYKQPQDNLNVQNVPLGKGKGRELKHETFSNSKKPNGDNPKPIYTGDDWGIKAPVSKIVAKKTIIKNAESGVDSNNNLDQIRNYVRNGDTHLTNKQYRYAIREYKKALELDPNNSTLKNQINKIEAQLKKREGDKVAYENKQKEAEIKAQKDAEFRRDRLKNQQQNIDNQIKAIKKAGDYMTSSMDLQFKQNASYNSYKQNVEAATRMRNSKDPDEIIRQFNSKMDELERLSQQRYNQVVKEIKAYHAQQSAYNTTQLDQAATNLGVAIGSMGLSKRIAKEKEASVKKLEEEKRRMLIKIKDNLVKDFKKNKENYFKRAASEIAVDKEKYYLDMAKYYQCKMDKAESRFSIDDTEWVDPDCGKVKENYLPSNDNPSDTKLYEASLRKYKNSNSYYQKASKDFIEMAIKANPKKADYFFHRAKFDELGSKSHINFLIRTLELNTHYPKAKTLLAKSLAEKKRIDETTFYDKNWKITSRKQSVYYRPLVDMVDGLYPVKYYYSSNNQLRMEGFATKIDKNKVTLDGRVVYYYETGKVNDVAYYDEGTLKQVIDNNKNGYTRVWLFNGKDKTVFDTKNYGKIVEMEYLENGFIKFLKWDYTRSHKKKYYKHYRFTFDEDGNLLFRDVLNGNGVLKDRVVEDNIEAMHRAALAYIEEGKNNEAIKFLENGIVLYPNDAYMYYYLAQAKSKKENLFTAINKGVVKNLNVSLTNKMSKNNEEAIMYFNKAIELSKETPDLLIRIYEELGEVYFKLNHFAESAEIYEKALKYKPKDPSLLNSYSRTLATSVQKLDRAEQMIKSCNEIEPNNYIFLDTHSWVLYKQGRFNEADKLNDKALKFGGDGQAIIWEHKGDIWYKLGEKGHAISHWEKAKSLSKTNGGEVSLYLNQKIKKKILLE